MHRTCQQLLIYFQISNEGIVACRVQSVSVAQEHQMTWRAWDDVVFDVLLLFHHRKTYSLLDTDALKPNSKTLTNLGQLLFVTDNNIIYNESDMIFRKNPECMHFHFRLSSRDGGYSCCIKKTWSWHLWSPNRYQMSVSGNTYPIYFLHWGIDFLKTIL